MKISMDMAGLNIVLDKREVDVEGLEIDLITNSQLALELHFSHNALRKIEEAIKRARAIQRSSLDKGEGSLLTVFKADL
jgi:hypothetical protein